MKNRKNKFSAIVLMSSISGIICNYFSIKEFGYFINVADLLLLFSIFLILSEFIKSNFDDVSENDRSKKKNDDDDDHHDILG